MILKVIAFAILMAISIYANSGADSNNTSTSNSATQQDNNKIVEKTMRSLNGIVEDVGDFLKINNISTAKPSKE